MESTYFLQGIEVLLLSKSPRRKELLQQAGIAFSIPSLTQVDESYPSDLPAEQVAGYLSQIKAAAYATSLLPGQIAIAADTTVLLGAAVLGKPADRHEAVAMLHSLSGRKHQVITGCTLYSLEKQESFSVVSDVYFGVLSSSQIDYYVDRYAPYDKAGGYGIQEWIGMVGVERIEGCFYNIMGLPVYELMRRLSCFVK